MILMEEGVLPFVDKERIWCRSFREEYLPLPLKISFKKKTASFHSSLKKRHYSFLLQCIFLTHSGKGEYYVTH
jgi:hypothetical protein